MTLKNPITRFNLDMDGSMVPHEHGSWVRAAEHDATIGELLDLLDDFEGVVQSAEVHEADTDWYTRAQEALTAFEEL